MLSHLLLQNLYVLTVEYIYLSELDALYIVGKQVDVILLIYDILFGSNFGYVVLIIVVGRSSMFIVLYFMFACIEL